MILRKILGWVGFLSEFDQVFISAYLVSFPPFLAQ